MKAKYIQPGNTIDYKNTGSSDITYGSIVPLGTARAGVAAALIPAGQTGATGPTGPTGPKGEDPKGLSSSGGAVGEAETPKNRDCYFCWIDQRPCEKHRDDSLTSCSHWGLY